MTPDLPSEQTYQDYFLSLRYQTRLQGLSAIQIPCSDKSRGALFLYI